MSSKNEQREVSPTPMKPAGEPVENVRCFCLKRAQPDFAGGVDLIRELAAAYEGHSAL